MTIQEALNLGRRKLAASSDPVLDTRLLLQHVLQVDHVYLVARPDQPLTTAQERAFLTLLARAAAKEPIPYLIGHAHFYGLTFSVNSAVLIPRPETELLVEQSLRLAKGLTAPRIVDVGTGSGCIAVSLAHHLPAARIDATEISPAALTVAQVNATKHNVAHKIHFHLGSLLKPVEGLVDLIVANLPYVADHEWTALPDGLKWYEPEGALRGGRDGLDQIRALLDQAPSRLASAGALLLEIGWQQGQAVCQLARAKFPEAKIRLLADYDGNDRLVVIRTHGFSSANEVAKRK